MGDGSFCRGEGWSKLKDRRQDDGIENSGVRRKQMSIRR
jgi:hypothetical protein